MDKTLPIVFLNSRLESPRPKRCSPMPLMPCSAFKRDADDRHQQAHQAAGHCRRQQSQP